MYRTVLALNPRHPCVIRDRADVQQMHRTVLRAFPLAPDPATARDYYDVLYHVGERRLLVQSNHVPDWSHLPDGYACDVRVSDAMVEYPAGTRLRFCLRANPTRKANGRRVPVGDRLAWLQRKAVGFELTQVEYQPECNRVGGGMVFASVLYSGVLVVTNNLVFRATLIDGVGSGKAFGFGMVIV